MVEGACQSCDEIFEELTLGLCATCQEQRVGQRVKQEAVLAFLKESDVHVDSYDSSLDSGTFRRPDFAFFLDSFTLIIEVDEHQHCNYTKEAARMIEIASIHLEKKSKPTIFIRFNPDSFKDITGSRVNPDQNTRHRHLLSIYHYIRENQTQLVPPSGYIGVVYLYYNRYIETDIPIVSHLRIDDGDLVEAEQIAETKAAIKHSIDDGIDPKDL